MNPCEKHGLGEQSVSVYVIINLQDIYQACLFFLCLHLIISFGDSKAFNELLTYYSLLYIFHKMLYVADMVLNEVFCTVICVL
jgi:hypothetical protein